MEKSVIFVCAIALAVTSSVYGDSGGCEIPKIAGGSLREERLGDWKWEWKRFKWARTVDHIMIRSGSTVSSGTILWLYCEEPYSVQGNGIHRVQTSCLGGRWLTELKCLLDVSCPEFTLTPGLNVTYSKDLSVGSIASFECALPTEDLNGSSSSICQEGGSWSNPLPSCEGGCEIPKIARGEHREERLGDWKWIWKRFHWERTLNYITILSGSTVSSGTVLWFFCDEPYSVHGNGRYRVETRCLRGKWATELQCLDQKCSIHNLKMSVPKEVEPDISKVTEAFVIHGFEVKLKCGDRSVIIGDSKAKCEKQGKWKLGIFQCVPGCVLNLDSSSRLLVDPKKEGYRFGERILLSCPPGEVLSSDAEQLMCLYGYWSPAVPKCNEVEKNPAFNVTKNFTT